jgi:RNase H-like domain found in reverse transcriptase/Reverse transcriptase (RNA-dependent DNA polymerase)/Retroviral aspartyl protease
LRKRENAEEDELQPILVMSGSENYKLAIELLLWADTYRPFIAVLDSGASHNIIREDALPHNWEESGMIDLNGMTRCLQDARGTISQNIATVYLEIKIGNEKRRVRFLVMKELAVPILLGCEFIDDHVTSIRSKDKTIQMNSGSVIPLYRRLISKAPTPVYLAQPISLPPFSETNVPVTTHNEGTLLIQGVTTNREFQKRNFAMATGISDVKTSQIFMLKVANYGRTHILLQKHTTLGIATALSTEVLTFSDLSVEKPRQLSEGVNEFDWKEELQVDHLSSVDQNQVISMLSKHSSMWKGSLGEISITKHHIELQSDAKPVYQPPYRAGVKAREVEKKEVDRMLAAGVIEPAVSEWASPVVLITKPDGSVRFCVDYRKLNALTIKDSYPLPRMDECLDSLGDATIFSTLDCNSGYWQILMNEEDRNKTAFVTHCGIHRFKRMPFGLCNAPATFQRALDMILAKVKWNYALIYLDDVIIYSKTVKEHMTHLDEVLGLLKNAGASLKLRKCHFFQTKVNYLGHVIYPGKLAVSKKNIDTIEKAVYPTKRSELRSCLGMCNVYRRFVQGFARIAAPLTDLLKKGQPESFVLNMAQQNSFQSLRDALIQPPILTLPKEGSSHTLDVDACDYQICACLLQKQEDGKLLPCGYYPRTLNGAERNYSTPEKECLAVVWAILLLRPYLEGTSFTVRSDQVALKWLLSFKDPSGRLARWRLRLAEFDFTIQYRPGIKNNLADGCSRLKSKGSDKIYAMIRYHVSV